MNFMKRLINKIRGGDSSKEKESEKVIATEDPIDSPGTVAIPAALPKKKEKSPEKYHPLTPEDKMDICKRIACFQNATQIAEDYTKMGKSLTNTAVGHYIKTKKWQPIIKKFRDEYLSDLECIPMANKVRRVEELNSAFNRAKTHEMNCSTVKAQQGWMGAELKIINQLQSEMEGKGLESRQNIYFTQFNNMEKEDFEKYRLGLVEKVLQLKQKEGGDAEEFTVEGRANEA